jgi:gliding motility-associated-like protein
MKLTFTLLTFLLASSLSFGQVNASFTQNDSIVCIDDCIAFSSTSTGNIVSYSWSFPGGSISSWNDQYPPLVCYYTPGDYPVDLTVTGPSSTSTFSKILRVGVYPDSAKAFSDTTIEMGGAAFLYGEGYGGGIYASWSPAEIFDCPTCSFVFASPLITTYAVYEFQSADRCGVRDSVLITVKYKDVVDVPNSFSPDDDGVNDLVFVKGPGITRLHFKIFDRYGTLMYETKDQKEGWDGTNNGEKLNPGVFLWTVEYDLIDQTTNTKSGTITLIK